nr:hypothetical protein [Lachnospiraceae bacterium]
IDPLEMEEEPLEEPEIELSPNVSEPEVQRIPANWETSKTKVLPQINFSEGNHLSQQIDEDDEDEYVQDPFEEDLEEADINDDGDIDEVERLADATLRESVDDLFRSSDNLDVEEDEGDDMEDSTPRNLTATVSQDDDNAIILTQEEKNIFSYFMPIDGMEQSICKALYNTRNYLKGKTDTGGHIIVQGIQGSGKTMLATSMVKVLQSQISLPAGNVGKVDGDKLNGKDIGKLFSKIQGGCLIIEKAGEINRETAIRLSLMMDNDTSGILIILEDSKIGIERLMKLSAKLSQEFTEKIVIPPFTIDELVGFAKKYATDCECVIDEMGILALYDRINIIQSLDHPTALEEVKVIMDEAMENADKGGFKFPFGRFAAKKYDENGFMILREKNFQN